MQPLGRGTTERRRGKRGTPDPGITDMRFPLCAGGSYRPAGFLFLHESAILKDGAFAVLARWSGHSKPWRYGLTTLTGLPARNARRFSTAISMRRWRLSFGAQEMCGVRKQFFAVSRGLSGCIGSVETTSSPAA